MTTTGTLAQRGFYARTGIDIAMSRAVCKRWINRVDRDESTQACEGEGAGNAWANLPKKG